MMTDMIIKDTTPVNNEPKIIGTEIDHKMIEE